MRSTVLLSMLAVLLPEPSLSEPILRKKTAAELTAAETGTRGSDGGGGGGGAGGGGEFIQPIPVNICTLPDGFEGRAVLVEDCDTLDQFTDKYESPPALINYHGSSVLICCPLPPLDHIFFPTDIKPGEGEDGEELDYSEVDPQFGPPGGDADNYDYGGGDVGDYDGIVDYDGFELSFGPLKPEERCKFVNGSECMDLHQCHADDISGDTPPVTCGYNADRRTHRFCCMPREEAEEESKAKLVRIRRGNGRFRRYPCEDYVPECRRWSVAHPESCADDEHPAFEFMGVACMQSCGHCAGEGCVDEFEKCEEWSNFHCTDQADTMAIYCRASCGTCGFYSPRNTETQAVNSRTYTYYRDRRFFCGAGKSLDEINSGERSGDIFSFVSRKKRQAEEEEEDEQADLDLFSYAIDEEQGRGFQCGSVLVNDGFAVLAAHCLEQRSGLSNSPTILIRDNTTNAAQYAVRRYFVHPDYEYPNLYSDIAVAELTRRIEYDYDRFGDSPACMGDDGTELADMKATSEGWGLTEKGRTSDVLLTVNVTIISNRNCGHILKLNTTRRPDLRAKLHRALRHGLNQELLCTLGEYNSTLDVYSGPCEGDSGGPLYVNHGTAAVGEDRRQTVEAIVSGGLGCGKNTPAWYTRVSSFRPWISCIMREVKRRNSQAEAERRCARVKGNFGVENLIEDL